MLRPFSRYCVMIGAIPESIIQSLSYEKQLLMLIKFLRETVIPAIDGNTEAIKKIEEWIENVDLQEFVDDKLDRMAESGELEEIISAYIQLKSLLVYNNVASMVEATNLVNGSYAYVLGHYAPKDGGSAHYRIRNITNDDIVDGYTIIALDVSDDLIAELNEKDKVTPEMFGAYGDNTHDDTEAIQRAVNYSKVVNLLSKTYKVTETIELPNYIQILGNGLTSVVNSLIDDGTSLFKLDSDIGHFNFNNFYITGNGKNCIGFELKNPYDDCRIENVRIYGLANYYIKAGNSTDISQSLLINNCFFYGSESGVTMDKSMIYLEKVYECNMTNTKLLYLVGNYGTAPCLYLKNTYDFYASGNSFADSSNCAIQFDGEARYNRLIGNTYENITGNKLIYFNGTNSDDCQYNLIVESQYYNSPSKVLMNNTVGNIIIGLSQEGGRRNFVLNTKTIATDSTYNGYMYVDGRTNVMERLGIYSNYRSSKRFTLFCEDSQYADNGLRIVDNVSNTSINLKPTNMETTKAGYRIKLISPDGNTTKYIGIANDGTITAYDSPVS